MPPAERSLGNSFFQNGTAIGAVVTPLIVLFTVEWIDPGFSARLAHYALGGTGGMAAAGATPHVVWQMPFRLIGAVGLVWVVLWITTVPRRALATVGDAAAAA